MRLDWAMLANHSEVQNGLAYISGAGIDTVNTRALPAAFNGSIVLRVALHPTEIDRVHTLEIRIIGGDGAEVARMQGQLPPQQRNADMPLGWTYKAILCLNIVGMRLNTEGEYSVEILADGPHLASLPFRVRLQT